MFFYHKIPFINSNSLHRRIWIKRYSFSWTPPPPPMTTCTDSKGRRWSVRFIGARSTWMFSTPFLILTHECSGTWSCDAILFLFFCILNIIRCKRRAPWWVGPRIQLHPHLLHNVGNYKCSKTEACISRSKWQTESKRKSTKEIGCECCVILYM